MYPQMQPDPLFPRIGHDPRHLQTGDRPGRIRTGAGIPEIEVVVVIPRGLGTSVDPMEVYAVPGCKIDVILVGFKIIPRRKQRIGNDISVPPGKGCPARFDPRSVGNGTRIVEIGQNRTPEQHLHRGPIDRTLHGVRCGSESATTLIRSCPNFGERRASNPSAPRMRYIPA